MPAIVVKGCPPWDGRYDLPAVFKNRELHEINMLSGTRADEILEECGRGNVKTIIAIAVVVLARAGKTVDPDDFLDADAGSVVLDMTDAEEADADPPTTPSSESEPDEK